MVCHEVARERVRDNKRKILSFAKRHSYLTGKPMVMGISMEKTMILAVMSVVVPIGWSGAHSTLPILPNREQDAHYTNSCHDNPPKSIQQLPWQPTTCTIKKQHWNVYIFHDTKKKWRSDLLSHSIKKDLANVSLTWFLSGPPRSESGSPDPQPPPTGQTHRQWTRLPSQESKEKLTRN